MTGEYMRSLTCNKEKAEMQYWVEQYSKEGKLFNLHYERFYTEHFGLSKEFYDGKRILDIGCGPRGSLEWADGALARVGIDPLANNYLKMGISDLKMLFIHSVAEKIPFPNNYFDIISSFNSLDHVRSLDTVISQIKKKLKKNGFFLLLTDVNHDPTPAEPTCFSWDIVNKFYPEFDLLDERHYEKANGIYQSITDGVQYNQNNHQKRSGVLSAKFIKR